MAASLSLSSSSSSSPGHLFLSTTTKRISTSTSLSIPASTSSFVRAIPIANPQRGSSYSPPRIRELTGKSESSSKIRLPMSIRSLHNVCFSTIFTKEEEEEEAAEAEAEEEEAKASLGGDEDEIGGSEEEAEKMKRIEEYNRAMQLRMQNPYVYHHELGIYYTRILENMILGSQPQSKEDIERLFKEEGVTAILNLQQDKDIQYWGIDFESITKCCKDLGIWYMRCPARDFDPNSLRNELPTAVSAMEWAISEGKTVYVHCTAGLGRAPAVAISYLFWFHGMDMGTAYEFVTSKRPCGPKKEAIRGATYDLAKNDPSKASFEDLSERAFTNVASWERQLIQDKVRALRRAAYITK